MLLAFFRIYLVSGVRDVVYFHFFSISMDPISNFTLLCRLRVKLSPVGSPLLFTKRET